MNLVPPLTRRARAAAVLTAAMLVGTVLTGAAGGTKPSVAAGAAPRPVRLMPLGDSITWGAATTAQNAYRTDLYHHLSKVGVPVDFVGSMKRGSGPDTDNEGHPSWEINHIAAKIDGWVATYQPDIVMLQIGVNDLARNVDIANAPQRLSSLIDQIRTTRPATRVVVAQITNSPLASLAPKIAAFNAAIPGVVATKGPMVSMVDLSMVGTLPGDLVDTVHPGTWGYQKMAYQWYRALEPLLNTSGTPWPVADNPFRKASTITAVSPAHYAGIRSVAASTIAATHPNGIVHADLYVNGVHAGRDSVAPYTLGVNTVGRTGTQTLWWKVTDRLGNVASYSRYVVTDNTAPRITAVSPGHGAKVRGSFYAALSATDSSGIACAELWVNGRYTGRDYAAPYLVRVGTSGLNGAQTLLWKVTDKAGNVSYYTRYVIADNTAPWLWVTKMPRHKSKVRGTVTVSVGSKDISGVNRVELLVNGKVVARDTRANYYLSVNTAKQARTMRVQIRAFDHVGNVRYSSSTYIWYR